MTKTEKTYGAMKVTEREYQIARHVAKNGTNIRSERAYQVVRYCEGWTFVRDDAVEFLHTLRTSPLSYADDPRPFTEIARDGWH